MYGSMATLITPLSIVSRPAAAEPAGAAAPLPPHAAASRTVPAIRSTAPDSLRCEPMSAIPNRAGWEWSAGGPDLVAWVHRRVSYVSGHWTIGMKEGLIPGRMLYGPANGCIGC